MVRMLIALLVIGSGLAARYRRKSVEISEVEGSAQNPFVQDDDKGVLHDTCHMKDGDGCPISKMRKLTYVYPDTNETVCYNGEPYSFAVYPGARDKLYFHFVGGGACWEKKFGSDIGNGVVPFCVQFPSLGKVGSMDGVGALNHGKRGNVFADYSVVHAIYCGGGAHVADNVIVTDKKTHRQTDFQNTKAVRDWALANFGRLSSFVSVGVSAGSLGSAFWANDILSNFQYDHAAMFWDSYSGIFPDGVQDHIFNEWNVCKSPLLSAEARQLCEAGKLTYDWVVEEAIKNWPNVQFVSLQPSGDLAQRFFFGRAAETLAGTNETLSADELMKRSNVYFDRYKQYPNYEAYIVNTAQHCLTIFPSYFTTNRKGPVRALPPGNRPGDLNYFMGTKGRAPPKPKPACRRRLMCRS